MISNRCDCTRANIIWVCKNLGLNYEFIFNDCLYFEYNKIYDEVGLNVKISSSSDNIFILSDRYELELKKYNTTSFLYKALCNDEILMVEMDTYFCRWTKYYSKQHIGHRFVVTRLNQDYLAIYDPFFGAYNLEIKICEIIEHIFCIFYFEVTPNKRERNEILDIFSNRLYRYKNRDILKEGTMFCDDIYRELKLSEDKKSHIEENIILQDLRYLSFNRYNYADTLFFLQTKYQLDFDLKSYIQQIKSIGKRWEMFNLMVVKCILKKKSDNIECVLQCLRKILQDEYNMVVNILYLLEQS